MADGSPVRLVVKNTFLTLDDAEAPLERKASRRFTDTDALKYAQEKVKSTPHFLDKEYKGLIAPPGDFTSVITRPDSPSEADECDEDANEPSPDSPMHVPLQRSKGKKLTSGSSRRDSFDENFVYDYFQAGGIPPPVPFGLLPPPMPPGMSLESLAPGHDAYARCLNYPMAQNQMLMPGVPPPGYPPHMIGAWPNYAPYDMRNPWDLQVASTTPPVKRMIERPHAGSRLVNAAAAGSRLIPTSGHSGGGKGGSKSSSGGAEREQRPQPGSSSTSGPSGGGKGGSKSSSGGPESAVPERALPIDECTTVMLRNLPECYTRNSLQHLLDQHGFTGEYDFIYMPMNFRTKSSFGYAFTNFVSNASAKRCETIFQGFTSWDVPSEKVCDVSWSNMHQGLAAHIERYRNSPVMHDSVEDEYKPAVFSEGIRSVFPWPTKKLRGPRIRRPGNDEGLEGAED